MKKILFTLFLITSSLYSYSQGYKNYKDIGYDFVKFINLDNDDSLTAFVKKTIITENDYNFLLSKGLLSRAEYRAENVEKYAKKAFKSFKRSAVEENGTPIEFVRFEEDTIILERNVEVIALFFVVKNYYSEYTFKFGELYRVNGFWKNYVDSKLIKTKKIRKSKQELQDSLNLAFTKTVNWKIKPVFESVNHPSGGITGVYLNGKAGFIDSLGKEVVPINYNSVCDFFNGIGGVERNSLWFFYDTKGKLIDSEGIHNKSKYTACPEYPQPFVIKPFQAQNGKYYFKNEKGSIITDSIFTNYIPADILHTYKEVYINGKGGLIDKKGKFKIPLMYESIFCDQDTNYIRVFINGNEKIINVQNENVLPHKYNGKHDLLKFIKDNKVGFKDINGNIVINNLYNFARPFKDGKSWVSLNDQYLLINHDGVNILPYSVDTYTSYNDNTYIVKSKKFNETLHINFDGKVIKKYPFSDITRFKNNISLINRALIDEGKNVILIPDYVEKIIPYHFGDELTELESMFIYDKNTKLYGLVKISDLQK